MKLKNIKNDDTIVTFFNGESEIGSIRILGESEADANYVCSAYFPKTDLEIFFTEDGIPNYDTHSGGNIQTAFLKRKIDEISCFDLDFSPLMNDSILTLKEIEENIYINNVSLEVRTMIGNWFPVLHAPRDYIDTILTKEYFHLFRLNKWIGISFHIKKTILMVFFPLQKIKYIYY